MKFYWIAGLVFFAGTSLFAQTVIRVPASSSDATRSIQAAVDAAAKMNGKPVVIQLENATYNLSRDSSTKALFYVSNTTSEAENPDPMKHFGIRIKGIKNLTFDGGGATLLTHGEMTSFAVEESENITLRNFSLNAADPTVAEVQVEQLVANGMIVRVNPKSSYEIDRDGKFSFFGHGWRLSNGIAQEYDFKRNTTWRGWSPLDGIRKAVELSPRRVLLVYDKTPQTEPGRVFQMRDGIRDEVCMVIHRSKNTVIEDADLHFLGNFGVVAQLSDGITYRNLNFTPAPEEERTCAGFADFVQVSGCKGRVVIENSVFSGAHDDPINVHGTHLKVTEFLGDDQIVVRYMHGQTYGFQSFFAGDKIDFIDENSLMPSLEAVEVKSAEMRSPREILVTLKKPLPEFVTRNKSLVVENVTYTPEVYISGNYFSRIPTRGILVSTRRKVLIENNTFFRMQMSGVLIADDARSWFESGMVRDVTIRNNDFIECGAPVILIAPENNKNEGYVHRNIAVIGNRFVLNSGEALYAKSVDGLRVTENLFVVDSLASDKLISTKECRDVTLSGNRIEKRK